MWSKTIYSSIYLSVFSGHVCGQKKPSIYLYSRAVYVVKKLSVYLCIYLYSGVMCVVKNNLFIYLFICMRIFIVYV